MKALQMLIDLINDHLLKIFEKMVHLIPHRFFDYVEKIKKIPAHVKEKITDIYLPQIKLGAKKGIGYTQHYLTIARGQITAFLIYLRSEEFKQKKKEPLKLIPLFIHYLKENRKALTHKSIVGLFFLSILAIIGINLQKIIAGTKESRGPASLTAPQIIDSDLPPNTVLIKDHKIEFKIVAAGGGGHGGGGGAHHEEVEIPFDIFLEANNQKGFETVEEMEEMVDDYLEALDASVSEVPIPDEELKKLELNILTQLNEGLELFTKMHPLKAVKLVPREEKRPVTYRREEKYYKLPNIDLQLFLEDVKKNRQVYLDCTLLSSNRNIVLFLKNHEVVIRDLLSTNVEPIVPNLPIDEEGKRIIKDKIRDEINDYLKKEQIEGTIIDVYIDYLMTS